MSLGYAEEVDVYISGCISSTYSELSVFQYEDYILNFVLVHTLYPIHVYMVHLLNQTFSAYINNFVSFRYIALDTR